MQDGYPQGCSLGLERLGLETVSRSRDGLETFFPTSRSRLGLATGTTWVRLGLVSVLSLCSLVLERLGLETVSRRFFRRIGLGPQTSRSRKATSRLHPWIKVSKLVKV